MKVFRYFLNTFGWIGDGLVALICWTLDYIPELLLAGYILTPAISIALDVGTHSEGLQIEWYHPLQGIIMLLIPAVLGGIIAYKWATRILDKII